MQDLVGIWEAVSEYQDTRVELFADGTTLSWRENDGEGLRDASKGTWSLKGTDFELHGTAVIGYVVDSNTDAKGVAIFGGSGEFQDWAEWRRVTNDQTAR